MRGTWQTTGSGGSAAPVLLIIGVLLLLGSGGAVAAVSAALVDALWAALAVVVLTVVATVAVVVHHARNPSQEGLVRMPGVRAPVRYELPAPEPERPAIGQSVPRELHNHYHFYGTDPTSVAAEILRRSQRPEQ